MENSQVSRYYVINTQEYKEKILNCLAEFNKENIKNAPVIIVSAIEKGISGFNKEGEYASHLKEGFQFFDNGLQVENLCLKAYELGLGTLIMGIYDSEKIREILNIPENQEIVAVIGIRLY